MSQLVRMDASGHTALAQWDLADPVSVQAAAEVLRRELEQGYFAVVPRAGNRAEQVRELPLDAQLVILRRPIAGG